MNYIPNLLPFCANVKLLRKKSRLTQKQMSKIMGIGVKSLSHLEHNRLPPRLTLNTLIKLAEYYQIRPSSLLSPMLGELLKNTTDTAQQ